MEDLDKWIHASKIAAESLNYGVSLIKPGAKLLDVTEKVEEKIKILGGQCAFPVQISMDHIAAHYCAEPNDDIIFQKQLCSLDVGVHIDGCIGDTAATVDLSGENTALVKASREALENAIKAVKIGIQVREIGKVIQETIESYNLQPVRNLSGHGLSPYNIHDSPQIPNFDNNDKTVLKKGMIIAIEPFATNGAGMIYETEQANIFSQVNDKPVRNPIARQILKDIEPLQGLPFTTRWLVKRYPLFKVSFALREMLQLGVLKRYPPLVEQKKGLVSQAEHTLLIEEKTMVLTRI